MNEIRRHRASSAQLFLLQLLLNIRIRKLQGVLFLILCRCIWNGSKPRNRAAMLLLLRLRRNLRNAWQARQAWVYLKPQHHPEELMMNRTLDFPWKLHFRVNRGTFYEICQLVTPHIQKENTRLRAPIPVEKRVGTAL